MADRMVIQLSQVLIKRQAAFGTAEATLINTDFAECESPAISFDPPVKDIRLAGATSGNIASVIGRYLGAFKCDVPLRTGGAENNFGLLGRVLPAFGMKEVITDTGAPGNGTTDRAVYTISDIASEWKDLTIWGHSGNKGAAKALLTKLSNVMFSGKLSIDFDAGTGSLSCEGSGACDGAPTAATQATCMASGVLMPVLRNLSFTIAGDTDYVPISMEIDFNQSVEVTINPATATGCGISQVIRNGLKWSAKVYKDIPTVVDPIAAMIARTPSAFSLVMGTGVNKITLTSSKQQITSVKSSDQAGVETYDLSGIFVDNDFTIQLDTL